MVKPAFEYVSSAMQYAGEFVPPGLIISLAAVNISDGKYWKAYRDEFIGTMLMIVCTFSAGKWWGADSVEIAWATHALGVIAADYIGGGLNWEFHFGSNHYIIKQTLTAVAIRVLIEVFPTAGPAMNPMLATAWDVFAVGKSGEFPSGHEHYFVYWVGPCVSAILASITYVLYAGGTIFGSSLPLGPLKGRKTKFD